MGMFKFGFFETIVTVIIILVFSDVIKGGCTSGAADFSESVQERTFVDKTLLIKHLFEPPSVKLITAPPCFGKSTNLDMVKRFLQIEVNENGIPVDPTSTVNYKLFKQHKLNIFREESFFKEHFGKHPVLYVDYKPLAEVKSFVDLLSEYRTVLHRTFSEHKYLESNRTLWLDAVAKDEFTQYIHSEHLTQAQISDGFLYLSRLLRAHFGKQVFVLVDEYDAFANSLMFEEPDDNVVSFVQAVNSALLRPKDYVGRALLTGVLRITGKGLEIPGVDVHDYYFMDNHTYSGYYGMTEPELDGVLNKLVSDDEERSKTRSLIQDYYKGYPISGQNTEVYNIMSVTKYLKTKRLKCYWHLPKYVRVLQKVLTSPDILHIMQEMLFGNTMEIDISKPFAEKHLLMLNHIFSSAVVQSPPRMKIFMEFLYHMGYLSLTRVFGDAEITLKVPNEEVKYDLSWCISMIYTAVYRFQPEHIADFQTVMDRFAHNEDNHKHFRFLHRTVNTLFNQSSFEQRMEKDFQTILYFFLLSKPEYSRIKCLTGSSAEDALVGNVYLSLTNRHGIHIYIKVKGSLAIEDGERPQKASATLRKIVNETEVTPETSRNRIFIGICFDLDKVASLAYSYLLGESDDLHHVHLID